MIRRYFLVWELALFTIWSGSESLRAASIDVPTLQNSPINTILNASLIFGDFPMIKQKLLQQLSSACYALQRNYWRKIWPIRRGSYMPATIAKHIASAPLWTQLQPGVKMLLDPQDLISRVLLETGEWDPDTWRAMATYLPIGGTFVDVGAHMGHCSLLAATLVGSEGRVVAIEANPEMVQHLSQNIQASGAGIEVQPVACSDSEGLLEIYVAPRANSGSSSISKANASLKGPLRKGYPVQARTLDAVFKQLNITRVDVLKIDVEGAELQVLNGAKETLASCQPVVVIELDDQLLRAMQSSSTEIHNFLASYGYVPDGTFDDANVRFVHRKSA